MSHVAHGRFAGPRECSWGSNSCRPFSIQGWLDPTLSLACRLAQSLLCADCHVVMSVHCCLQVAGYSGLLLAAPTVLYEIIAYVVPGLTKSERKFLAPIVFGSSILFYTG